MINRIFAILTTVLGTVHCILTPMFYKSLTLNAVCFVGAGLVFVILGFLNLAADKTKTAFSICLIGNIISAIYALMFVIVLKEFQAVIGLILVLGLTVGSLNNRIKS
jgi:hypothetical protein